MLKFSTLARITTVSAISVLLGMSANAADRISDFSLIDHYGRFHQLSRYANHDAVVLLAHADSRDVRRAASDLDKLVKKFADNDIAFFLIDSTGAADKTEMREVAEDADITLPILMDDTQLVAEELGITKATDVVIINPKTLEVVYRGALNRRFAEGSRSVRSSAHYVADALDSILAGQAVTDEQLPSKGDAIEFAARDAHAESVSYANDIAPILEQRCVTCHMEGGIAPFAMSNHQMIQGWSPMIREVIYTKRMPPGQIDNDYVEDFHNVSFISIEESQKLVHWIDQGSQNNDGVDPLAALEPVLVKWNYAEKPDIIIAIPEQHIPAIGVQEYRNLQIPLDITEDIWVKAIEFVPGDPTVLHHIIAFAYGPDGVNQFELLNQGIGLGAYAPGNAINTYPENSGFPLKAGGGLMLQMHYTVTGKEAVDASEIGLYLWDEPPARPVLGGSAADLKIHIPPFTAGHEMIATKKFRKDVYLSMLGPHMHYRGYDANFKLIFPDGREQEILNVPNYQFNWQKVYDFKEPMFLPAGTEMIYRATFDNSEMNPFNPDPSATISWGEQTWQEMFFGFFRYVDAD